ncbi:response regulator [endosymbiont of Ridgeia piscesae]|uniref:response regulator n=1 Tax=endosymbiont of Ridgeia piscesae TaxID=54398 RepID=UPI0009EB74A9|nr:response regulator [endosymbiont of Ridgeia piscesae]
MPFAGARAAESGIRILLAEDNAIAAKVLFTLLQQKGHRVCIARDGQEALELLQAEQFHLAFVDLRMPRMDGFELTRRYRQLEPETEHLPILALTANAPEDVLQQCSNAARWAWMIFSTNRWSRSCWIG